MRLTRIEAELLRSAVRITQLEAVTPDHSPAEAKKGWRMMLSPRFAASSPEPETRPEAMRLRPAMEETVYRMFTVGAILLVLGSLWAF